MTTSPADSVSIHCIGRQDYQTCWQAMQHFTNQRDSETIDQIWLLEHEPVYTLGQNGKIEHLLNPNHIPLIKTDRGGQITYHGPGQLVVYPLIDLKRKQLSIRGLVTLLEQCIIKLLATYHIHAVSQCQAPGVYVYPPTHIVANANTADAHANTANKNTLAIQQKFVSDPNTDKHLLQKICSIGLRIRRGCAYHGIALNVSMDLRPFTHINPCGFTGLAMTQMSNFIPNLSLSAIQQQLINFLITDLRYTNVNYSTDF